MKNIPKWALAMVMGAMGQVMHAAFADSADMHWEAARAESHRAWMNAKARSHAAWLDAKQKSHLVWEEAKQESFRAWDEANEASHRAWEKARARSADLGLETRETFGKAWEAGEDFWQAAEQDSRQAWDTIQREVNAVPEALGHDSGQSPDVPSGVSEPAWRAVEPESSILQKQFNE